MTHESATLITLRLVLFSIISPISLPLTKFRGCLFNKGVIDKSEMSLGGRFVLVNSAIVVLNWTVIKDNHDYPLIQTRNQIAFGKNISSA